MEVANEAASNVIKEHIDHLDEVDLHQEVLKSAMRQLQR